MSVRNIAQLLTVNKNTVQQLIQRYRVSGSVIDRQPVRYSSFALAGQVT